MIEMKTAETIGLLDISVFLSICTQTNKKNIDEPINSAIRVPNTESIGDLFIANIYFTIYGPVSRLRRGSATIAAKKDPKN